MPERTLATNGDLAKAYLDVRECLDITTLKLGAVRELAGCRVDVHRREKVAK